MMIICDTRERKNHHILEYFNQHEIPYDIRKLDTGDYMDEDNIGLTIDRKQNLDELCGNLLSPDKSRFWREVRRAKENKMRMIVLIEDGDKCLKDVLNWKSRYKTVPGQKLYNEICRCHIAYGVEFWFCNREDTGKRIVEILSGGDRTG